MIAAPVQRHVEREREQPHGADSTTKGRPRLVVRQGDVIRVEHGAANGTAAFVVTVDNPFFAVVRADGRFSLGSLPAGNYTVEAWHERLGTSQAEVTVPPGGVAEISLVFQETSPLPWMGGGRANNCEIATRRKNPVVEACRTGGVTAAKKVMKMLVSEAKARGRKFTCEGCHEDLDHYALSDGAERGLAEMLKLVGR